jgi:hypothetical protein
VLLAQLHDDLLVRCRRFVGEAAEPHDLVAVFVGLGDLEGDRQLARHHGDDALGCALGA